jgi:hypothetical protein
MPIIAEVCACLSQAFIFEIRFHGRRGARCQQAGLQRKAGTANDCSCGYALPGSLIKHHTK